MTIDRRTYAWGTYLDMRYPWGTYVAGRALCSDGRVRTLKRIAETADTFFSVPAAVTVHGRTVSGYVTVDTLSGSSVPTDGDPMIVRFRANRYGRNASELPDEDGGRYAMGEARCYCPDDCGCHRGRPVCGCTYHDGIGR